MEKKNEHKAETPSATVVETTTVTKTTTVVREPKIFKVKLKSADSWSGIQQYENCRLKIGPAIDHHGRPVTGLSKEDQERLEDALHLEPGTLSPTSAYWKEFYIGIDKDGLTLNTADPMDELYYLVLSRDKKVAKSLKEKSSRAVVVMYNEGEEAKTSNLGRAVKVKAFKKFSSMSHDDMKKVLQMYGKRGVGLMANDVIEDTLGAEVELNPQKFLDICDDPHFEKKIFIGKLIDKGILKRVGSRIIYDEQVLGGDLNAAIFYLWDAKNQTVLAALKKQLGE